MIVVVTEEFGVERVIRLDDPDNFTELAVDVVGLSRDELDAVAGADGAGFVEGDHLWIDVDFLRSRGRGTVQWNAGFAAMIAYARGKGWTDADGTRVRAHIRCG
ncbi:MAG: hypothetical protein AAGC80_29530 [Rhodococcus sp. (in: high G+C Gram-positive bacteria)]